jgi:disulfide bond formation protein DsbB
LTRTGLILLAVLGSASLLGGAFLFQYFGYPPCAMCLWQRWPHAAAIVIGVVALAVQGRLLPALGALAGLTTAGIGIFHTGVERDWWEGPASCTGTGLGGLDANDLLSTEGPRLVMCDKVSWELFTISMPSWNAIFSLILVAIWVRAVVASRRP